MSFLSFVIPLLVIVSLAFYYLNFYRKGKAVGGGLAAGVQASQEEKWRDHLQPGEHLQLWGTGVLWRPWWQYELGRQVPVFRLIWPVKMYQLILTNQDRVLLATVSSLGF